MRLICPVCGARDRREFNYRGAALERPAEDASADAWEDYMHTRDNPAGPHEELWCHEAGCGAWLIVTRDLSTHHVLGTRLAEGKV